MTVGSKTMVGELLKRVPEARDVLVHHGFYILLSPMASHAFEEQVNLKQLARTLDCLSEAELREMLAELNWVAAAA